MVGNIIQFNFLMYLIPSRDVWYVSLFFLIFTILFLDCRMTGIAVLELLCSIVVSWFILGEKLLPPRDGLFVISLVMQVVVILMFYGASLLITYLLHRFLVASTDRRMSVVLEDLESSKENANTDALTGLFNRRYADLFFSSVLDRDMRYCVALLDIDDFKKINDTYGHPCGDQVLVYLADFLRRNLRKSDYVFRWGGEEFLIVLSRVESHVARGVLEKLRLGLAQSPVETKEAALRVTVTIGVASLDADDIAASIKACDDRLYYGKRNGKNRVVAE
jgi:diguanylate cyclase (GGDEF)-like protein